MVKFASALKNLETKNAKVTRNSYKGKAHFEMTGDKIVRIKSNGATSDARISSDDLLADDWKVIKD